MSEESLFHDALQQPAAERPTFLDAACAGDAELRARVERLLAAHAEAGGFLEANPQTVDSRPEPTAAYAPGGATDQLIAGRYRLVEKIGEGGMGEVWVAKQIEPVQRRVALKLIKAGMDSKAVLARFEQERQALALMDHPNIARVLDGGLTEQRRPYFVMELVNGMPLTRFCDEAKLPLKERLDLFVLICQAVQHAHQKGIVHRDLKPSNILITLYDGRPTPKVIDFGVAKATGGKLTDGELSTQFGAVVGTLEYMAPEQANLSAQDVDTRADIYSLGVILYELLTGLRPFDSARLKAAALDEVMRILREEDPPRPSTRLSSDASRPSLAAARQSEPKRLSAALRGELDWLVMKCLEKERGRRYETASGLARDVQRYLSDEPVEARPASAGYRLRKFVGRNRGVVLASLLILLALIGGIIGTAWQALRAKEALDKEQKRAEALEIANEATEKARRDEAAERLKAETAQKDAEKQRGVAEQERRMADKERDQAIEARKEADNQRAIARAVSDFFQGDVLLQADSAFQASSRHEPQPRLTVRQALDRAAKVIGARFKDQPLIEAAIQKAIGDAYRGVGAAQAAALHLERALVLHRAHLGERHRDTMITMNNLAGAYSDAGLFPRALALLRDTLVLQEKELGREDADTLTTRNNLAAALEELGDYSEARRLAEETLPLWDKAPTDPEGKLSCMNILANIYFSLGELKKSLALAEEAFKLCKASLGHKHPNTLVVRAGIAAAHRALSRSDRALTIYEEILDIAREQLGPDHPYTLRAQNNVAVLWRELGRSTDALTLLEKTLAQCRAALGDEHPNTLNTLTNLATSYRFTGRLEKATPLHEDVLRQTRARLGDEHPETLHCMNNLAENYNASGRVDEAIALFKAALDILSVRAPDHPDTLTCKSNLAAAYACAGYSEKAISFLEEVLRRERAVLPPDHPNIAATKKQLESTRAFQSVTQHFEKALAAHGPDDLQTQVERLSMAQNILGGAGMHHAAEYHFRKLLAAWDDKEKRQEKGLIPVLTGLGDILVTKGKHTEAEPLLRRGLELSAKYPSWTGSYTSSVLGGSLTGQKKFVEAEKLVLAGYSGLVESDVPLGFRILLVPPAVQRVVQLYEAWDKKEEADKWRVVQKDLAAGKIGGDSIGRGLGPVHEVGRGLELKGRLDEKAVKVIYEVKLSGGKTYVIDMTSANPKALDPYLVLADPVGVRLQEDDDGGSGLNSRITFRAAKDGVYRLQATSYDRRGNGEFVITIRER